MPPATRAVRPARTTSSTAPAAAASRDSSSPEAAESELSASPRQPHPRSSLLPLYHVGVSPTIGYAAPFVPWASRASEMFCSWRNKTSSQPWLRRRSLSGDSDMRLSPKPSTTSRRRGAPAQKPFIPGFPGDPRARTPSGPPSQKPFIKWTHGDPRAHTPMLPRFALANQGATPPAPPPSQSNRDASHPPSPAEASKDCQGFLAQLAFAALVFMGVRDGLDDLLSGWNEALKVIFVLSLIVGAGTLAAGLMATSPVVFTGYTRTVLSTCARFCTCLAAFVLIIDLSFLMGSHGYIAGIILGIVSVLFSVSVWIMVYGRASCLWCLHEGAEWRKASVSVLHVVSSEMSNPPNMKALYVFVDHDQYIHLILT